MPSLPGIEVLPEADWWSLPEVGTLHGHAHEFWERRLPDGVIEVIADMVSHPESEGYPVWICKKTEDSPQSR